MAINYWFHPIDTASYENPYSDPLWERLWRSRGLPLAPADAEESTPEPAKKKARLEGGASSAR